MNPNRLKQLASFIFGSQGWQKGLARLVGRDVRTIGRWAAGEYQPPPDIGKTLKRKWEKHKIEGDKAFKEE